VSSTLIHSIENSALRFPERDAFRCGNLVLNYKELQYKTDQLAKQLIDFNVEKGDRVGIFMPRCIETAIATYGIMKSGAAYVPLDPLAPPERTKFLIDNCDIDHVISVPSQKKQLLKVLKEGASLNTIIGVKDGSLPITSVSWDTIFSNSIADYQKIEVLEQDIAYIMFTSGSTGTPKGIVHTHRSGLNYAKFSAELYALNFTDRVANHAPLHFDICTFGYFSAPWVGACTIIIPDAYTKLPASLSELMAREKITLWYSVPLALVQLLLNGVLDKRNLSTLKWVLFGGESFPAKHLNALMQHWPHARFSNVYGPAEINQCTYYHLDSPPDIASTIPLGEVWKHATYKILDLNDEEVKKGNVGELAVCTTTMMEGYWKNKELTRKSIYTEETTTNLKHRYYRTGDLVRENEQKELLFIGRNDRQVKLRGYRIEMDEVENVLVRHKEVKEVGVFLSENEVGDPVLNAAVVLTPKASVDERALTKFCASFLPSYAIPENIYFITEFPRTSSGKIKRSDIYKIITE